MHMVQFWDTHYIVNCTNHSQDIYSGNMRDCKGVRVLYSRNNGTLTTYIMQIETLHIQFSKKQTRILYIVVNLELGVLISTKLCPSRHEWLRH